MRRYVVMLAVILTVQANPAIVQAEFIANAFGGQAEAATRAAAARAFEGYQNFYAAMSQLERGSPANAEKGLDEAVARFKESQGEYQRAAGLLPKATFDVSRLDGNQGGFLFQFLEPFDAKSGSDQAGVMRAYANSYSQTITLIQGGSRDMSLVKFRDIQAFINRQIIAGTFISRGLGR